MRVRCTPRTLLARGDISSGTRRSHAGTGTVALMDRRIFGLENEYGVTCTLRGQRRLSPDEVARYLFRRVVSWGRSSNVFLAKGARPPCRGGVWGGATSTLLRVTGPRLSLDVGSHPEYATPECDSVHDLVV